MSSAHAKSHIDRAPVASGRVSADRDAKRPANMLGVDSLADHLVERRDVMALQTIFANLPIGVALVDINGPLLFSNDQFKAIYGGAWRDNPPAALKGLKPEELSLTVLVESGFFDQVFDDPKAHFDKVFDALSKGEDYRSQLRVGERIMEIHDRLLPGGLILTTQTDVTERVEAEERVAHMARHDPLTGVPNRTAFNEELARLHKAALANNTPFAVISIDLDRFKDVNDVFGHSAGDMLLEEMALRFRHAVGDNFLARLGGDEFVVLCTEAEQPQDARQIVEELVRTVRRPVCLNGQRATVGVSAGVAVFPKDGKDIGNLLNAADAALYRAKAEGRGTYRFFEPDMDRRIHDRRVLARELRTALTDGEFTLDYQPQATIDGEVIGFEALLRWTHKRFGQVSPDDFITVAEENGLIVEMGEWVLRTACAEAAGWEHPLTISVNLSPVQFRHGDLACLVHKVLGETGLAPGRLELEITETALVHDFGRVLGILRRIKALGVKIVMDDFGTGYSSLSYLQAFPFDRLKIDKSFVARIETEPHAKEIIRAVIGLGRGLNLPVTAKGVETDAQRLFLATEQCASIQGYLVGRPEKLDRYEKMTGERHHLLFDEDESCQFVKGQGMCRLDSGDNKVFLDDE